MTAHPALTSALARAQVPEPQLTVGRRCDGAQQAARKAPQARPPHERAHQSHDGVRGGHAAGWVCARACACAAATAVPVGSCACSNALGLPWWVQAPTTALTKRRRRRTPGPHCCRAGACVRVCVCAWCARVRACAQLPPNTTLSTARSFAHAQAPGAPAPHAARGPPYARALTRRRALTRCCGQPLCV